MPTDAHFRHRSSVFLRSSILKIHRVLLDHLPISRRPMRRVPMKARVSDLTAMFFADFGF